MASIDYTAYKLGLGRGRFAFQSDTLKCVLLNDTHVPSAADAVLADIIAEEVVGAGYTTGGATLAGVTWTATETALTLKATNPVWPDATITARYAAIYAAKTVDGVVNPLISLLDFGQNRGVIAGVFTADLASGIAVLD